MSEKSWRRGANRRKSAIEKEFQDHDLPFPIFDGKLNKQLSGAAKKAYTIWYHQRERCHNRKCRSYKWYGARGISVQYSSRQFIGWWLEQTKTKKDSSIPGKKLSCDRINNDGNYCFSNIQVISVSENSKKQDRACAMRPVIWHSPDGDKRFPSIRQASLASGITPQNIYYNCTGRSKAKRFSYESGNPFPNRYRRPVLKKVRKLCAI